MTDTTTAIPKIKPDEKAQPKAGRPEETVKAIPVREGVLNGAGKIVTNEFTKIYGEPSALLDRVAALWEPVFGQGVTTAQVALCLDLVNTAKLIAKPDDLQTWAEKAAYSAMGGEVSGG